MKYFIDFEFIEGFTRPVLGFGKKRHFIDLISIGIVAEDGREYYAISNEFNPKKASQWCKDNVISKLPNKTFIGRKSNAQIAEDIINFVNPDLGFHCSAYNNSEFKDPNTYISKHFKEHNVKDFDEYFFAQPEFYAYYADYDWVLFCSLFGTMMQLPTGFPMYCRDLKQILDEKAENINSIKVGKVVCKNRTQISAEITDIDTSSFDLEQKIQLIKEFKQYPKQENEHNALDDAKWNYKLYKFLQTI